MYFYFTKNNALVSEREIKSISVSPYKDEFPPAFGIEFVFQNDRSGIFGMFDKDGAVKYLEQLADQIGMGNAIVRVNL